MANAASSHGRPSSCGPRIASIPTPVIASPAPTRIVPWPWSQRRACTTRLPDAVVRLCARSANGRRIDGRNNPTASVMWIARRTGSKEDGIAITMLARASPSGLARVAQRTELVALEEQRDRDAEHERPEERAQPEEGQARLDDHERE